ncbi:MAG: hypothetical protein EXQ70_07955 [Solirubrobacterales bacterium]|nr:hypothetical protein [Solirubrobacterales bacterium]
MSPTETTPRSVEEIARAYFEAVGDRDVDAMMALWEPGGYGYIHGVVTMRAPEGYQEWFGGMFEAVPDLRMEIVELIPADEHATVRWSATGTFTGPVRFEGLEATGASLEMEGLDLLTIRDGKIREVRAYMNATEMARQLGAMPPAGSLGERAMLGAVNARTAAMRFVEQLRDRA